MLITPHATLGAAIATQIGGPVAIPLAFASHFLLDKIPHWQSVLFPYKPTRLAWIVTVVDLALAFIFVNYLAGLHPGRAWFIWLCAFLAAAPDLDSIVLVKPKLMRNAYFKRFHAWHVSIQRETNRLWGLIPQVVVVIISIFLSV